MKHKVYIIRCPDYAQADEKCGELFALLGGTDRFVSPEEHILLKVNLLAPAPPERAVCTHPAVVSAVARLVQGAGASALIADSPGSGYHFTEGVLRNLYRVSGMTEAAALSGAALNYDTSCQEANYPQGRLVKRFEIMTPVAQADGVLNLCKLKTHVFMGMTGAVKNNFGVIPGLSKVGYHAKLQQKDQFAQMLLDLCDYVAPRLSIMDAVVGLEGEGPGVSGTPRPIGLLLASESPLALDLVAAEIIGLALDQNPLFLAARALGLSPTALSEVEIIGPPLDALRIPDFKHPENTRGDMLAFQWWMRPFEGAIKSALTQMPQVTPALCVGCGVCRDACPAGAIRLTDAAVKKAHIDPKRCIHCYCCHELCPKSAVALKRSALSRLLRRLS